MYERTLRSHLSKMGGGLAASLQAFGPFIVREEVRLSLNRLLGGGGFQFDRYRGARVRPALSLVSRGPAECSPRLLGPIGRA
jgi:hypothetical protein